MTHETQCSSSLHCYSLPGGNARDLTSIKYKFNWPEVVRGTAWYDHRIGTRAASRKTNVYVRAASTEPPYASTAIWAQPRAQPRACSHGGVLGSTMRAPHGAHAHIASSARRPPGSGTQKVGTTKRS
eukprot:1481612-Prymnesium_polylepis.1